MPKWWPYMFMLVLVLACAAVCMFPCKPVVFAALFAIAFTSP